MFESFEWAVSACSRSIVEISSNVISSVLSLALIQRLFFQCWQRCIKQSLCSITSEKWMKVIKFIKISNRYTSTCLEIMAFCPNRLKVESCSYEILLFSANIGVPGKTVGCMFTPVQVEINTYEPEKVGGEITHFFQYSLSEWLFCYSADKCQ